MDAGPDRPLPTYRPGRQRARLFLWRASAQMGSVKGWIFTFLSVKSRLNCSHWRMVINPFIGIYNGQDGQNKEGSQWWDWWWPYDIYRIYHGLTMVHIVTWYGQGSNLLAPKSNNSNWFDTKMSTRCGSQDVHTVWPCLSHTVEKHRLSDIWDGLFHVRPASLVQWWWECLVVGTVYEPALADHGFVMILKYIRWIFCISSSFERSIANLKSQNASYSVLIMPTSIKICWDYDHDTCSILQYPCRTGFLRVLAMSLRVLPVECVQSTQRSFTSDERKRLVCLSGNGGSNGDESNISQPFYGSIG